MCRHVLGELSLLPPKIGKGRGWLSWEIYGLLGTQGVSEPHAARILNKP